MRVRLREFLSFANVLSVIALFIALGGTGYAAGVLPPGSVGTLQLKDDAVTGAKVKGGTLKASDFARGALKAGPRGAQGPRGADGPAGPAGTPNPAAYYTQAEENARFLGAPLVTVVVSSAAIAQDSFGSATATCPTGYQVISGGADSANVLDMKLTSSQPLVAGTGVFSLPDGQNAAPNAWRVFMANSSATPHAFKVAAVCARLG